MPGLIDFVNVSAEGVESSPVAEALAGLRANEARYFSNKFKLDFVTKPAAEAADLVAYVAKVLLERDIVIQSQPLEAVELLVDTDDGKVRWTYVFFQSGLEINVLYPFDSPKKRAVGFKLSQGMEVPQELASKFKFARQKSKLAGEIRGSFFVVKGEY